MLRYVVLGLLRNGGACHGYALIKEYRDRAALTTGTQSFYRELQRLAAEGLICAVASHNGNDPRRALYQITDNGVAAFDRWFAMPANAAAAEHEDTLSTRALFLSSAEPAVAQKVLVQWREELWIRSKLRERAREIMSADEVAVPGSLSDLSSERPGERTTARTPAAGQFSVRAALLSRRLKHLAVDLEFVEEVRQGYERWADAEAKARQAAPVARQPQRPTSARAAEEKPAMKRSGRGRG